MKQFFPGKWCVSSALVLSVICSTVWGKEETTLVFKEPEVAGMSGLRAHWNTPILVQEDGLRRVQDKVVTERGQTAIWGKEMPGPIAIDAVHRNVLVRFPEAAETIAAALTKGRTVEKIELVLPFLDEEIWPPGQQDFPSADGYRYRTNWENDHCYRGVPRESTIKSKPNEVYREERPNWHAVAQVLRKPWQADAEMGPTYNAAIPGAVYWKRFGASDETEDRFPKSFGPTEVSVYQPEGRMDLTEVLTNPEYGQTIGDRLRVFSDNGVILSKWEVYDSRYFQGAYEFAISSGPRAILLKKPYLEVRLGTGSPQKVLLPPAANVSGIGKNKQNAPSGNPTAVLPNPEEVAQWNDDFMSQPEGMPDWQYAHIRQLMGLRSGGKPRPFYYLVTPEHVVKNIRERARKEELSQIEEDYLVYLAWIDWIHGRPPRFWEGHLTAADNITLWYNFQHTLPAPVQESIKRNWSAWLMPDRVTAQTDAERKNFANLSGQLIHPMADDPRVGVDENGKPAVWGQGDTYFKKTGDWRGNKSYYRSGFTRMISTANFNSGATSGALLNGQIIGSERAIEDGRVGLMIFPFWLWTYNAGLGQEYIDHYYWAIATAGNKLFADFAKAPQDQMVGWSIKQKTVNDLAISYHPNLRKLIGPASRTYYEHVLGQQDGLYHILHVLSPKGALTDMETGTLPALTWPEPDEKGQNRKPISAWGHDYPPESVALNTMSGPWADTWITEWVDEKPLPWRLLAEKKVVSEGDWVTAFFGENYGLSSIRKTPQRIHVLGHWRRKPELPKSMRDIGTLDLRVGFNQTQIGNDLEGKICEQGSYRTYQHDNRLILLARPNPEVIRQQAGERQFGQKKLPAEDIFSVQCTAALFNFTEPEPDWEIFVDLEKVNSLPAIAEFGQVITIHDGVTYLAIRPLPTTDLGRTESITLTRALPQTQAYHEQTNIQPALLINANFFQRKEGESTVFDPASLDGAMSGFVLEIGDEKEFGNFANFQAHIRKASLKTQEGKDGLEVVYSSGGETLEARWDDQPKAPGFLVNGKDPYAEAKKSQIWQDTTLSQMAVGRRLEKSGALVERAAVTASTPMFLQVFPRQKVAVCFNPVPNYQAFRFQSPEGVSIAADGLVSMSQWVVKSGNEIAVKFTEFETDGEAHPSMEEKAMALFVSGIKERPHVTVNNQDLSSAITAWEHDGQEGWLIPLREKLPEEEILHERFRKTAALIAQP